MFEHGQVKVYVPVEASDMVAVPFNMSAAGSNAEVMTGITIRWDGANGITDAHGWKILGYPVVPYNPLAPNNEAVNNSISAVVNKMSVEEFFQMYGDIHGCIVK